MAPTLWEMCRESCHIGNEYVVGVFAEFFGTFLFLLLAVGAGLRQGIACVQFTSMPAECNSLYPLLGTVLGLIICITIFGGASGGYFNPAVTLGLAVSGKLDWVKVPLYWTVQFLGAYFGAGMAYAMFLNKLEGIVGSGTITDNPGIAYLFAPAPETNIGIVFTIQIFGTAIFLMVILAAMDERNLKVPPCMYGALFGATLLGITFSMDIPVGNALNPARDLGARLMAATIGFNSDLVFRDVENGHYWLAPMLGPFIGAILGALIYVLAVGAQLEDKEEEHLTPVPPMRQLGAQGQATPNWRHSELLQGPPPPARVAQKGRAPPPPQKKKSGGGGGFSFGKLADLGNKGFEAGQNFDTAAFENPEFDNVLDTAQQAHDAYNQGKEMYDLGVEAHDLGRQGYDAYRGQQSPPPRGHQPQQGSRYREGQTRQPYQSQQRW